jgi:hypothetical protein
MDRLCLTLLPKRLCGRDCGEEDLNGIDESAPDLDPLVAFQGNHFVFVSQLLPLPHDHLVRHDVGGNFLSGGEVR